MAETAVRSEECVVPPGTKSSGIVSHLKGGGTLAVLNSEQPADFIVRGFLSLLETQIERSRWAKKVSKQNICNNGNAYDMI